MAGQSFLLDISMLLGLMAILSSCGSCSFHTELSLEEATLKDLQRAFYQNKLTSRQLVEFYLEQVRRLNPILKGIIEVNPDALDQASRADLERKKSSPRSLSPLHGIPVLVKDNIATKDKLNTTAGSFALLGSVVPRDAGVVTKLRMAGAIIFGKASLSEWSYFRSNALPSGWSARGGQGKSSSFSLASSSFVFTHELSPTSSSFVFTHELSPTSSSTPAQHAWARNFFERDLKMGGGRVRPTEDGRE